MTLTISLVDVEKHERRSYEKHERRSYEHPINLL